MVHFILVDNPVIKGQVIEVWKDNIPIGMIYPKEDGIGIVGNLLEGSSTTGNSTSSDKKKTVVGGRQES